MMQNNSAERKCTLCGRGLARTYGPEIPCVLCVRFGPPSVRCGRPHQSKSIRDRHPLAFRAMQERLEEEADEN